MAEFARLKKIISRCCCIEIDVIDIFSVVVGILSIPHE